MIDSERGVTRKEREGIRGRYERKKESLSSIPKDKCRFVGREREEEEERGGGRRGRVGETGRVFPLSRS